MLVEFKKFRIDFVGNGDRILFWMCKWENVKWIGVEKKVSGVFIIV